MEADVKVTEAVKNLLVDVVNRNEKQTTEKIKEIEQFVKNGKQKPSIPFSLFLYAHKNRSPELRKLYLNELLENSDIVLQELIPPTRDPELEARIQKLKLEQGNKAYRQITKNIDKIKYHESSDQSEQN